MNGKHAANLAARLEKRLPAPLLGFLRQAGEIAEEQQQQLYLVGGVVRDALLDRPNTDLDMVLAGDAIPLAGQQGSTDDNESGFEVAGQIQGSPGTDSGTAADNQVYPTLF